jgi:hypothetical protein
MDKNNRPDSPVGYKKPPRHSQFKPGQSGNAKGRPKQSPKFADVVSKQLRKKVKVTMGDKVLNISMFEAIAIKHVSRAINGDPKSTAIVLSSLKPFENDHDNNLPELLQQFRAIYASHAADESAVRRSEEIPATQSDDINPIEED